MKKRLTLVFASLSMLTMALISVNLLQKNIYEFQQKNIFTRISSVGGYRHSVFYSDIVLRRNVSASEWHTSIILDVKDFTGGAYLLILTNANRQLAKRIVIEK